LQLVVVPGLLLLVRKHGLEVLLEVVVAEVAVASGPSR
jgi:hypothetical protein